MCVESHLQLLCINKSLIISVIDFYEVLKFPVFASWAATCLSRSKLHVGKGGLGAGVLNGTARSHTREGRISKNYRLATWYRHHPNTPPPRDSPPGMNHISSDAPSALITTPPPPAIQNISTSPAHINTSWNNATDATKLSTSSSTVSTSSSSMCSIMPHSSTPC